MAGPQTRRLLGAAVAALFAACSACDRTQASTPRPPAQVEAASDEPSTSKKELSTAPPSSAQGDVLAKARSHMVESQLAARDITDQRVLKAMAEVPRHRFVPQALWQQAYEDYPLPIGLDQTISQPYVVAFMTQALGLTGNERVLEIGTGSGYQAAVLAKLCKEVYSIEIIPELSARAGKVLNEIGAKNVYLRVGDGYRGWPEKAPFDGIMVTAAPPQVPQPLIKQLAQGGRMILPVGDLYQDLVLIEKTPQGLSRRKVLPVRFVPMTGEAQRRR